MKSSGTLGGIAVLVWSAGLEQEYQELTVELADDLPFPRDGDHFFDSVKSPIHHRVLEVLSLLGVGGMGEVYRANDTKLDRQVAIKVLPEILARDSDRLARFEREAKVLASVDHPNLGHIYGLVDSTDSRGLAVTLIEGPRWRIKLPSGLCRWMKCWRSPSKSSKPWNTRMTAAWCIAT